MTASGIAASAAVGVMLLLWVVTLIRRDRLYAGYGVIFVLGTIAALAVLLAPPLLRAATAVSAALLPVPSLALGILVIFTFLIVYLFVQISILSNRVMTLTQELAIRSPQQGQAARSGSAQPN